MHINNILFLCQGFVVTWKSCKILQILFQMPAPFNLPVPCIVKYLNFHELSGLLMHFGTAGEILILTDLKINPCCLKCSVAAIASEVLEKVTKA